jgi:hypothetical protein
VRRTVARSKAKAELELAFPGKEFRPAASSAAAGRDFVNDKLFERGRNRRKHARFGAILAPNSFYRNFVGIRFVGNARSRLR